MKKLIIILLLLVSISTGPPQPKYSYTWLRVQDFTNTRYFIWQGDTIDFTDFVDSVYVNYADTVTMLATHHWIDSLGLLQSDSTILYVTPEQLRDSISVAIQHDPVTLAASATTGGLSLSTQEISFQPANASQNGYLTSADWITFNAKIATVSHNETMTGLGTAVSPLKVDTTLIATRDYVISNGGGSGTVIGPALAENLNIAVFDGTSGDTIKDGTYTIAEVLNLGNATGTLDEGNIDADIARDSEIPEISDIAYDATSWDGNTDGATKNAIRDKLESLPGGHDPITIGTANGLSLSTQELSLGLASISSTGALSSTDWNTFNNKQDALTTGNLTENIAGIEFDYVRQVIGGAAQLSLSSGYVIPTTEDTTFWGQGGSYTETDPVYANDSANIAWLSDLDTLSFIRTIPSLSDVLGQGNTTNNQTVLFDYDGGNAAEFKFGTSSYKFEEITGNDLSVAYGTYGDIHTEMFRWQDDGVTYIKTPRIGSNTEETGGVIRYTSNTFQGYNGTSWVSFGGGDMYKSTYDTDDDGDIDVSAGGTNIDWYTIGDILYANGNQSLAKLSAGANGYVFTSNGPGAAPSWQASPSSLWNDSDADGIYYTDGNVSIGTSTVSSTYLLRAHKEISGGYAAWFNNGSSSGNGVLIQGGNGSTEYALRVTQEDGAAELFSVRGNGYLYANSLTNATTSYTVYYDPSSGLMSYDTAPSGDGDYLPLTGGALTGAVTNTSTFTAENFITNSDKRLKKCIRSLSWRNLDWVDDIKFYSFRFKGDLSKRRRYGVIAQQVEKYAPEIVHENDKGVKAVGYVDLLVVKVARQEEIINELIKRIERLERNED